MNINMDQSNKEGRRLLRRPIPLYPAAWLLIPGEGSDTTIGDEIFNSPGQGMS